MRHIQVTVNRYEQQCNYQVAEEKINNIVTKQTTVKTWLLILFFLLVRFHIETIQAQIQTFPNSNQLSKPPSLQELNKQQQVQIQQQNRQQMENLEYLPPPTPQQQTWDYYDQQAIARQQKEKELYEFINPADIKSHSIPKVSEKFNFLFLIADTNSAMFKNYFHHYRIAYNEISEMLSGKKELSLKRTVFVVENAYHQNKLNYTNYCKQINELVLVCKQILKQKGLKSDNYMACHYAIQKLFSESFTYKNTAGKTVEFIPFGYDFDDYMGKNDYTKMFVTKLMKTKTGQCHSLPLLYLIIAEELHINAFLGLAPNHSYIKFGNQYQSYNFETTNGSFVSDKWIVGSGYISSTAIKNQIYLAPLTKQQVIAECLVDLSSGLEYYVGKSDFTIQCATTTLIHFPKSIRSLLIINNFIVAQYANTAKKYKFPKEVEYHKYPDLKKQFDKMVEFELELERTGYIKIPPEQYEQWQFTVNEEKQQQEHLKQLNNIEQSANEN